MEELTLGQPHQGKEGPEQETEDHRDYGDDQRVFNPLGEEGPVASHGVSLLVRLHVLSGLGNPLLVDQVFLINLSHGLVSSCFKGLITLWEGHCNSTRLNLDVGVNRHQVGIIVSVSLRGCFVHQDPFNLMRLEG